MDKKLVFFEKADVNGANTREVYSFLKSSLPNDDGSSDIRWNFGTCCVLYVQSVYFSICSCWLFEKQLLTLSLSCCCVVKFLVDHEGKPVTRNFGVDPLNMKDEIEALLKKKEAAAAK